jgi:SAM-dependent methyltransferase
MPFPTLASVLAAILAIASPPADAPPKAAPPATVPTPPDSPYRTGPATRDGIGKYFHDREIAQVMGHQAAAWLERPGREREERTDVVLKLLDLPKDADVADIGAGTGYFSFPMGRLAPDGTIYAVDIQDEMLALVRDLARRKGVTNVVAHRGEIDDVKLPPASVDVVLIVDAYHEFSHPAEMLRSIRTALRPGGRLVLVEYRAEDPDVPIKPLHKMSEKQARRELEASGFEFVRNDDTLPQQHFLVFRVPEVAKAAGTGSPAP